MTDTEKKWSERVREWKGSGLTAKQFSEGREFKASTLVYWASCLRRGRVGAAAGGKRQPRVPRMARVVRTTATPAESIVVSVGSVRVAVRAGFDEALLRQVVRALGDA